MNDPILDQAVYELTVKHGCHTVILYGSRSRGDFTDESDYDLAGFRDSGPGLRDARLLNGKYLDAFIYPHAETEGHEKNFLHLRNGTVLTEQKEYGTNLLERIEQVFKAGPSVLSEDEKAALRVWIRKMLKRSTQGDVEGDHRRAWLQFELLQIYFQLRNLWYLGSKESLDWISRHDPAAFEAFKKALKPGATHSDLENLARAVTSSL
jgi:hypothetical protein